MEHINEYKSLIESLKLLACSYDEQKLLLPNFVDVQDEVLNTFYESFLLLPVLIESNYMSMRAIAAIVRLNNWITLTEQDGASMNLISFKEGSEWNKVRALAKKALDELNEGLTLPDLSSINWVPQ
ncbi:hypothetical protein ACDQ55_21465 [Chitinophaga sp. 30R24]|uniref:hypothetical protein n=1 Tax=Chitinophaga sp. 30R24 TaxID=3248838 RepID=UPI003B8F2767